MKRARALVGLLAVGGAFFLGPQAALAHNTRMVGFGIFWRCVGCHGGDIDGSPVGQYWPAGSPGSYPNRAGAHPQHIAAMAFARYGEDSETTLLTDTEQGTSDAKQQALCAACHPNPGQARVGTGEASHAVNVAPLATADLHNDGRTPATATLFRNILDVEQPEGFAGSYNNSTAVGGKSCSTVDCHYRVTTPSTGTSPNVGWYNSEDQATCSNCHGSGTEGAVLPNVHQAHVGSPTTGTIRGKGYVCTQCHPDHGVNMGHQNGAVDLSFAATLGEPGLVEGSQAGSDLQLKFAPPAGRGDPPPPGAYATCSNFYCHGADLSNGGTSQTPRWNDYSTGSCGTCHGVNGDPVAIGRPPGMAVTSGNHLVHLTELRGPRLEDPVGQQFAHRSNGCYECHNSVDPSAHAAACEDCHYPAVQGEATPTYGAVGPGASRPTPTHVDGSVDFGNTVQTTATQSVLGTTAPAGAPDGNSTDRCNGCHSTTDVSGIGVGTVLAKANWVNAAYELPCITCHNAADPATRNAGGSGVLAPFKDTHYATRGHGLSFGVNYAWVPNRSGAGAVCSDCHDGASAHISGTLGDSDRLVTAGNTLCNGCHDGTSDGPGGKSAVRVSTHGNRSTTMSYTAKRSAFELNCVECHDVHGSANAYMVNTVNTDGPLVPVRYYSGLENLTTFLFGGTVSLTAIDPAGPDYASSGSGDTSKICQTCHTATSFYKRTSGAGGHPNTDCIVCHKHAYDDDFGPESQDGFMPAGCNGCHGYPPIRPSDVPRLALPGVDDCTDLAASSSDYQCENYVSGGGFHWAHVEALKKRFPTSTDARELCGPCHGDGAGSADHNGSNNGPGNWPISARGFVNIRAKASVQSSWGEEGTYNGAAVTAVGTTPPGSAMDAANSRCAALDCHGNPTVEENLNWLTALSDGTGVSDGLGRSRVCKGCHDQTPAQWRVYSGGGSLVYTGNAPNAAANYYGTLSGYSRGGHGDAGIQSEDPFINSASGTTPIDCTACHSDGAPHFPADSGNLHRLSTIAIQTNSGGLCNECHDRSDYPLIHHPSFYGPTAANSSSHNIVPSSGTKVLLAVTGNTEWSQSSDGSHYTQSEYGYSSGVYGGDGNPDRFINWWGGSYGNGNQDPPPRPVFYGENQSASPKATLPLARHIGNQVPTDQLMCTTCHNPHGTDLFVYDVGGIGGSIPDNNMLRLRDFDKTLCTACHTEP